MTKYELSSFTFVPLGLWGRSYRIQGLLSFRYGSRKLQGHRTCSISSLTLQFAGICFPDGVVLLHYSAVECTSHAIELHGCSLHESQYLKHRR